MIYKAVGNGIPAEKRSTGMECYLDNSATTKPCEEAVKAAVWAMRETYGNPSSLHRKGFEAEKLVAEAHTQLAAALSCEPSELLFTSGATESNNMALFGAAEARKRRGKTILISAVEHPSVMEAAAHLEAQGFSVKRILPDENGVYTPECFAEEVDGDTILVSAMMVNNETGLILPVKEIAKAVKAKNPDVLFHTDAVQAFLKLPIRLKGTQIDLLSVSGHKVCAPKGVGALFVKKGVRIAPLFYGGGQQNGLRSGTESVPLIAAFGAAAEKGRKNLAKNREHYESLRALLVQEVAAVPQIRLWDFSHHAPHIVSLSVYGVRSETMLHYLEQFAIYVSSGSACARGKHSYVLSALGMDKMTADETLRISFAPDTTDEMVRELVRHIAQGAQALAKQR